MQFLLRKGDTFLALARRFYDRYNEVSIGDGAAQLAYSMLFALFALLFVLVTLAAYLPLQAAVDDAMERVSDFLPSAVVSMLSEQLRRLFSQPRPKLLGLSLLLSFWTTSRGVDAMRVTLNRAYHVRERRSYLRTQALSLLIAVSGTLLIVSAFFVVLLGGKVGVWLFEFFGRKSEFLLLWGWLRWPLTGVEVLVAAALAYHVLPDVDDRFQLLTPGSVVGALGWLLATWGFTFWSERASSANATYGSIAGVMLLLTWLYLSAFVFLLGGLVNAVWQPEPRANGVSILPPLRARDSTSTKAD